MHMNLNRADGPSAWRLSRDGLDLGERVGVAVIGFGDLQCASFGIEQCFLLIQAIVVFDFCVGVAQTRVAHAFYEGIPGFAHQAQFVLGAVDVFLGLSELIGGLLQGAR